MVAMAGSSIVDIDLGMADKPTADAGNMVKAIAVAEHDLRHFHCFALGLVHAVLCHCFGHHGCGYCCYRG